MLRMCARWASWARWSGAATPTGSRLFQPSGRWAHSAATRRAPAAFSYAVLATSSPCRRRSSSLKPSSTSCSTPCAALSRTPTLTFARGWPTRRGDAHESSIAMCATCAVLAAARRSVHHTLLYMHVLQKIVDGRRMYACGHSAARHKARLRVAPAPAPDTQQKIGQSILRGARTGVARGGTRGLLRRCSSVIPPLPGTI
mmetsp:Transcript_11270/g.47052  ORF Transcript_11270/g.47052 Transcript_11270/m.47052 type:complete len:200 (-) Transcript_11270:243-842(-)